jgi:hypothetical protein
MMNSSSSRPVAMQVNRRGFLSAAAVGGMLARHAFQWNLAAGQNARPRVAAIFTEFTYRSHAHVLLENFLGPYLFNGKRTEPGVEVVAFYADQFPARDMAKEIAGRFRIPMFGSIEEALCLGGKELAVDAVLSIGEHGQYPVNPLGQREYPRKQFFDQSVAVMRRSNRFVPLFNDKHLSYRWDWALEMFQTARELGIPFMAGSSVPLAERRPALELPNGTEIEEAVSVHGGPLESYDFHAIEVLQSMIEFRRGGETGISRVEFLTGDALWKAADEGRWSRALALAALQAELGRPAASLEGVEGEEPAKTHGILLTYRDGLRATVLKVGKSATRWSFACRRKESNQIEAARFYVGPWNNRNLFKALSHAIQRHFARKRAPYPVERTLLATGALAAAMHSRRQQAPVATPELEFGYEPLDFREFREMGATWKIITDKVPEPPGLDSSVELLGAS